MLQTAAMNSPQKQAAAAEAILPPPPGFKPLELNADGFIGTNGPLYGRLDKDGKPVLGLRIERRHCNPLVIAHGGCLAFLADMVLGFAVGATLEGRRLLPTISMNLDYLAPAPLGCWLEGEGRCLRVTRNLGFADALLTADGVPALRASGILKITDTTRSMPDIISLLT